MKIIFILIAIFALSVGDVFSQEFSVSRGTFLQTNPQNTTYKLRSAGSFSIEREGIIYQYWTVRTGVGLSWSTLKYKGNKTHSSTYFYIPVTITRYFNAKGKVSPFVESGNAINLRTDSQTFDDSLFLETTKMQETSMFLITNSTGFGVRFNIKNNLYLSAKATYNIQINKLLVSQDGKSQRVSSIGFCIVLGGAFKE